MKKAILALGKPLNRKQQSEIKGGGYRTLRRN